MPPTLAAPFAEELAALLGPRGESLAGCEQVSSKSCGGQRMSTYCLTLSKGGRLKARRYTNLDVLERHLALRECFTIEGYPQPLAHTESILLEPWIEGEPLAHDLPSPAQLHAAGSLLAQLHTQPSPPQFGDRLAGVQARLGRLEERLNQFAANEHLTQTEAAALLNIARTTAPRRNERGLVHRDFRPENLIWNESGLVCIDLDTLDFGPFEEDLARVWLLWPMSSAARDAFWQGYARHRSPNRFLEHFAFWAIYSAVNCLQFRLEAQDDGWEIPLARLHELAALDPANAAMTSLP